MQAIFQYVTVGDLWGLAIIALTIAVIAANCLYQKYRMLARDRFDRRIAQARWPTYAATIQQARFPDNVRPLMS